VNDDNVIKSVTKHVEQVTGSVSFYQFSDSIYRDMANFYGRLKIVGGEGDLRNLSGCRSIIDRRRCERYMYNYI